MPPTIGPRDPVLPKPISSPTAKKEDFMAAAIAEFNTVLHRYNVPVHNGGDEGINAAVRAAIEMRLEGPIRDTGIVDAAVVDKIDDFLRTHEADMNVTNPGQISHSNVSALLSARASEVRNALARSVTD